MATLRTLSADLLKKDVRQSLAHRALRLDGLSVHSPFHLVVQLAEDGTAFALVR